MVLSEKFVRIVLEKLVEVEEKVIVDERLEKFGLGVDIGRAALIVARVNEIFVDLVGSFVSAVGEEEGVGAGEIKNGRAEGGFFEVDEAGDGKVGDLPWHECLSSHTRLY